MEIGDALFPFATPCDPPITPDRHYLALTFDLVYSTFIYLKCQTPHYGREPFFRLPTCTTVSHRGSRAVGGGPGTLRLNLTWCSWTMTLSCLPAPQRS